MKDAKKMRMPPLNPKSLTIGERHLLLRRRRWQTKAKAAKELGVTQYEYNAIENSDEIPKNGKPSIGRNPLALHEASLLLRRRKGIRIEEFAKRVGCSAWWLTQMERGVQSDERLREYWKVA